MGKERRLAAAIELRQQKLKYYQCNMTLELIPENIQNLKSLISYLEGGDLK